MFIFKGVTKEIIYFFFYSPKRLEKVTLLKRVFYVTRYSFSVLIIPIYAFMCYNNKKPKFQNAIKRAQRKVRKSRCDTKYFEYKTYTTLAWVECAYLGLEFFSFPKDEALRRYFELKRTCQKRLYRTYKSYRVLYISKLILFFQNRLKLCLIVSH